jgi:hypothetical protein
MATTEPARSGAGAEAGGGAGAEAGGGAGPGVRVGITGHTNLTVAAAQLVYRELLRGLRRFAGRPIVGVTCLAYGADQLFARAVLAAGGRYEVILPAADYRARVVRPEQRAQFDDLIERASEVSYTGLASSGPLAYAAANLAMLDRCDHLFAVWDGTDGDSGGTADVLSQARGRGLPVTVVWPDGARRLPG